MDNLKEQISESRRSILQAATALGLGSLALGAPAVAIAAGKKTSLQTKVNAHVRAQRRSGRVSRDEKTSWSVYDFTTGAKLVAINEDVPRQAASMIKPFIAQAYFYRHVASPSRYPYNSEVEQLMASMIRHSRNQATNELIARVSNKKWANRPKQEERILREQAPGIFQQVEVVEYIPKGGRTYRNKASAHDYSRFLYGTWNNRLPGAEHMKELMALPNADRIYQGTGKLPKVCASSGQNRLHCPPLRQYGYCRGERPQRENLSLHGDRNHRKADAPSLIRPLDSRPWQRDPRGFRHRLQRAPQAS